MTTEFIPTDAMIRAGRKPCPVCGLLDELIYEKRTDDRAWLCGWRAAINSVKSDCPLCSKTDHPGEVELIWEDRRAWLLAKNYFIIEHKDSGKGVQLSIQAHTTFKGVSVEIPTDLAAIHAVCLKVLEIEAT